jgi:hypothetical protein
MAAGRDASGRCRTCKNQAAREKRARDLDSARAADRARYARQKEVLLETGRRYRQQHPETELARQRKKRMRGLPDIAPRAGYSCDCCGNPVSKTPHADHNHQTGRFRGWLCARCNLGMSFLDRPAWLENAAAYLRKQGK